MATGEGRCADHDGPITSIIRVDRDEFAPSTGPSSREGDDTDSELEDVTVELEFEWRRLCHGCGERKWFRAMICDDCRDRHRV